MTRLLGLDFAELTLEQAVQFVLRQPPAAPFDYIVTPNADHLVRLRRQPELLPIYQDAALRLLDLRVIAKAARAFGLTAPPVVTGSDLVASVLDRLPRDELVTILGLRREFLRPLIIHTGIRHPAHFDPPEDFDADPAAMDQAVQFVLDHPTRLVLLAVGSPRQEQLAAAIKATGRARGLALCVGAGLDFLSGAARRAPVWMQRAGLEWFHRLATDPRRLCRRYLLDDPPIFPMLLAERSRQLVQVPAERSYLVIPANTRSPRMREAGTYNSVRASVTALGKGNDAGSDFFTASKAASHSPRHLGDSKPPRQLEPEDA